ncbi:hypothetical protein [Treponema lecithinolyticum]|uniref:Response regulatory domain-containing protein n=1 Tax=Treponema lecithinolyticum ATCC 700332 TaxID=1321815 RepID=A0ABN0P046_TRELE|nr:hypothetical protein [Treponema lecithinolyticum]ERJ93674.1 hypothetical protein HMPREF9193_00766 [Treponema lecithinolyticum ATCC 700332]
MKALLVAESEDTLNLYRSFFESLGYDTVCYRWLLKALDNVDEIMPQVIFMNAVDYPRHWKILVQYIRSGLCKSFPVVLLAAQDISNDDLKKAEYLEVHCIRNSIESSETKNEISTLLNPPIADYTDEAFSALVREAQKAASAAASEYATESAMAETETVMTDAAEQAADVLGAQSANDAISPASDFPAVALTESEDAIGAAELPDCGFTLFHPKTKAVIAGTVSSLHLPLIFFKPEDKSVLKRLRMGQKAPASLKENDRLTDITVQIQGFENGTVELCVLK